MPVNMSLFMPIHMKVRKMGEQPSAHKVQTPCLDLAISSVIKSSNGDSEGMLAITVDTTVFPA